MRLVDGTTLSLPDTPTNQAAYPQPSSQPAGLGFPLYRMAGLLCLGSAALHDAAIGRHGAGFPVRGASPDPIPSVNNRLIRSEKGRLFVRYSGRKRPDVPDWPDTRG